jgi:hypothetical protein
MRLDKDLWTTNSQEYNDRTVVSQDVQHLTPPARVFIALWLELLQEDRAPENRALSSLAIPDQLAELLSSLRSVKADGHPTYRVRSAIRRLSRQRQALRCTFIGDQEAERLCNDASEWLGLVDEADQKTRRILEQAIRTKYGYRENVDLVKALQHRLVGATMGTLAQVRGQPDYKGALVGYIRDKLSDGAISPLQFYDECEAALRELLALVLDTGNSRESLAELPIKYLRADNATQRGRSLGDRAATMFGAFWGSSQDYEVLLPLGEFNLGVRGDIFPPGVTILDPTAWQEVLKDFASSSLAHLLPADGTALRVVIGTYLKSGLAAGEQFPLDVFAARDVAVRAAQACLDAVFLYREHRIQLDYPCGVIATTAKQNEGAAAVPYRAVLHQRHEYRTRTSISLDFLRPVPAAWADALHWYRLGNVITKDESGIVNLWTASELLSSSCHGTHGTAIDRVQGSVGVVAAVSLFADQQRYLAIEAVRYARQYERVTAMRAPTPDSSDADLLAWWLDLCAANDENQLFVAIFDLFPLLAAEALRVRTRLAAGSQGDWYDAHKSQIVDNLSWIYGCRNDVVHVGRVRVPGASIARAVASEYVGTALQATLAMRARGSTSSLAECFALAIEKERTLRWHLENGRVLDAVLTAYR